MQQSLRILVADPDPTVAERLGPHLRRQGHRLSWVGDGNRALETSILQRPDVIVVDEACPFLSLPTFLGILRGNPRTASIPVIVQGTEASAGGENFLRKPVAPEAILGLLSRLTHGRGPAPTEGHLSHLSLVDLLQMFSLNRKSGRLLLRLPGEEVEFVLNEGRIHDARGPAVQGEKAIYRYLGRKEGTFEFRQGVAGEVPDRIGRTVDQLLLEAMRQGDELELVLAELPGGTARLSSAGIPAPSTAAEAEVARALASGPLSLDALLDSCKAFDLEIARVVLSWLEAGHLSWEEGEEGGRLPPGTAARFRGRASVLLWDVEPMEFPGVRPTREDAPFGLQGELWLDRNLVVELSRLPRGQEWLPLARLLLGGAVGILSRSDVPEELNGGLPVYRVEPGTEPTQALLGLLLAN